MSDNWIMDAGLFFFNGKWGNCVARRPQRPTSRRRILSGVVDTLPHHPTKPNRYFEHVPINESEIKTTTNKTRISNFRINTPRFKRWWRHQHTKLSIYKRQHRFYLQFSKSGWWWHTCAIISTLIIVSWDESSQNGESVVLAASSSSSSSQTVQHELRNQNDATNSNPKGKSESSPPWNTIRIPLCSHWSIVR